MFAMIKKALNVSSDYPITESSTYIQMWEYRIIIVKGDICEIKIMQS